MFYGPRYRFDMSRIDSNCSHVVIDGVTAESQREWDDVAVNINGVCGCPHILVCSSAQLKISEQFVTSLNAVYKVFIPWTMPEYRAVCGFDPFFAEVYPKLTSEHHTNPAALTPGERNELLEDKYITAGFSCRYMFDKTAQAVIDDITMHFNRVSDASMLISGLQGSRSHAALNHLIFSFGIDLSTPVSSLVVRRATRICDEVLIRTITQYSMSITNPSFDGWVLEFDVLHALRRSASAEGRFFAVTPTEIAGVWTQGAARNDLPPPLGTLVPVERIENNHLLPEHLGDRQWFYPTVYNNGGFDAVQLLIDPATGVRTFRFAQITRAITHSLKISYMDAFTTHYNTHCEGAADMVSRVEVLIIAPIRAGRVHYTPRATVLGTLTHFGWAAEQLQIVGFVRSVTNA
jgi:hypothetical protein